MRANKEKVKVPVELKKEVEQYKPKRSEFYKFMNIVFSANTWL